MPWCCSSWWLWTDSAHVLWMPCSDVHCICQPLIGGLDVAPVEVLGLVGFICCRHQWYICIYLWASQQRSEVIFTPRYFASVSVLRVWPWSWNCNGRTMWRWVMSNAVHFGGWNFDIFQRCSQSPRLSRPRCRSCGSVTSLWKIASSVKYQNKREVINVKLVLNVE